MPAVINKTQRPLSVPLPGGKTLHLGPGKTGQVSAKAVESSRFKSLVDAGEIEVVSEDARTTDGGGGGKWRRTAGHRQTTSGGIRRSGDR
jgi:hypothetical protein